ncbi:hypothetical protein C2S53_016457 [Perilla frutescens var. hirtella]|uniref:DUF4408 domain-containing protein n=1 Tax=Perilla frutescens var. hirtella TaxID=608512 RepID=A0AAD4IME3_PERFH|nr:hypothetical protein C2S53_016457 [Perilla frutescens var. hirtella]
MDSFKFHDVRVEKANATAKYRKIQKITSLFRFMELLVVLIVLSRFSTQFASSLKLSGDYFRGISMVALISPRSVFVVGNVIVIALFLISGQFSDQKSERSTDFYDEYVEKCRNNQQTWSKLEAKRASHACEGKVMISRTNSVNLEKLRGEDRRRDLRRSVSDKCRNSGESGRKAEDQMSSEEFRQTVEAFIARQQRFLREEEEFSAVVSFQP